MSQQIHPSQLRIVNNRLAELGKIVVYQPDMFRSRPELQQDMIACCKAFASYMTVHMLTASIHLATVTPALAEQLNHARKKQKVWRNTNETHIHHRRRQCRRRVSLRVDVVRFFVHEWRPCEHSSVQTLQDEPMPLHDGR